ncbi:MAG: rod shape-determining protein MreD [Gemmatimonadetes bacterium]|nr:rod shape-determining protein MreD [Gemmatimonadota bacterium]
MASVMVLLLVLGQYAVRPLLPDRPQVGFLLVAVLFVAVRVRPGVAALVGFLFGVTADATAATPFGATALLWLLEAFVAASMRALLFSEQVLLPGLVAFGASWLGDLVAALGRPEGTAALAPGDLLLWAPLTALATGLLAVAVHLVARDAGRTRPY